MGFSDCTMVFEPPELYCNQPFLQPQLTQIKILILHNLFQMLVLTIRKLTRILQ